MELNQVFYCLLIFCYTTGAFLIKPANSEITTAAVLSNFKIAVSVVFECCDKHHSPMHECLLHGASLQRFIVDVFALSILKAISCGQLTRTNEPTNLITGR